MCTKGINQLCLVDVDVSFSHDPVDESEGGDRDEGSVSLPRAPDGRYVLHLRVE